MVCLFMIVYVCFSKKKYILFVDTLCNPGIHTRVANFIETLLRAKRRHLWCSFNARAFVWRMNLRLRWVKRWKFCIGGMKPVALASRLPRWTPCLWSLI